MRDLVSAEETISRTDECRLLFLSVNRTHTHTSLVPFESFGTTVVSDCNLEVREHAVCESHELCYSTWAWDCQNDSCEVIPHTSGHLLVPNMTTHTQGNGDQGTLGNCQTTVDYNGMDRERDTSKGATRNIFMVAPRGGGVPYRKRGHS